MTDPAKNAAANEYLTKKLRGKLANPGLTVTWIRPDVPNEGYVWVEIKDPSIPSSATTPIKVRVKAGWRFGKSSLDQDVLDDIVRNWPSENGEKDE